MTFSQALQLYAPLLGLLALAFWSGVLSQRVSGLEREVRDLKEGEAEGGAVERLVRLEVQMENNGRHLESIDRNFQGMQRQFANLVTEGRTAVKRFTDTLEE